ncbi:MAG: hypothetical protein KA715_07495 [Xanthomonadaceae bacterium]|nr:hypothetical protein [Xanthomonadaceae bacterium]
MINLIAAVLFSSSVFLSPAQATSNWCSKVESYFSNIEKNEEYSVDRILGLKPDVILFGEMHNDWTSHDAFMKMMAEIKQKDADYDCVFMEMSEELNEIAMDDWLARKITFETMASHWCDEVKASSLDACKERANLFYVNYFRGKLEKARDMGLKVHYMDATHDPYFIPGDWRIKLPKWYYTLGMVERNMIMARNIAEKLGRNQCKKAFVIVGGAHINEVTKKEIPSPGMVGYLETLGYSGIPISFFPTKPDPKEDNWLYFSPFYSVANECKLSLPMGKVYNLPERSPNTKTAPEELEAEKWVYEALPSLKDRPFGTYGFVYLHDCPECAQKPIMSRSASSVGSSAVVGKLFGPHR